MKSLLSLANKYEIFLNKKADDAAKKTALLQCANAMQNMYAVWLNLLSSKNFAPADGTFKYSEPLAIAKNAHQTNNLDAHIEEFKTRFSNALNTFPSDVIFDAQAAGWYNKGNGVWSDAAAKDAAFKAAEHRRSALTALEQVK
jgi:hypothetical protein